MVSSVLVVVGGLPATGKTAVARLVAHEMRAAFLRIDTVEDAISRSEGRCELISGDEGYVVGYGLAADQLALGLDVVVECVNPIAVTRDAWLAVGDRTRARVVEVELTCSDRNEHRRRLMTRRFDFTALTAPRWRDVADRDYEPWKREHLVIDTCLLQPDAAAQAVVAEARRRRSAENRSPDSLGSDLDLLAGVPSHLGTGHHAPETQWTQDHRCPHRRQRGQEETDVAFAVAGVRAPYTDVPGVLRESDEKRNEDHCDGDAVLSGERTPDNQVEED